MAEQELTPAVWTVETLRVYQEALRLADEKFQQERDRRYTEIRSEQEKALQIKDKANDNALALAAKIQEYKDEKANELRSQIERERGLYVTREVYEQRHDELRDQVGSLDKRVTEQFSAGVGSGDFQTRAIAVVSVIAAVVLTVVLIVHG